MRIRAAVFALALLPALWPVRAIADGPAPDAPTVRKETFETVWRIVDQKFFDPEFNGVDWKAVHDRYAPLVAATKTDDELYAVLNKMLGELHVSHFGVRPPESVTEASGDPDDASWGGGVGMTVRIVEGRPTVVEVQPDGPADRAGLLPGFVLTRIGTRDLAEVQRKVAESKVSPVMESFLARRTIQTMLGGMPGKPVEVSYLDAKEAPHTTSVGRKQIEGKPLRFGQLPTIVTNIETKRLANGIGYLKFNIFLPQMMDDLRAAIDSFKDAPAIIIDLRNNPGGVGLMAPAVAGKFLTEPSTLGTMKMRRGEIRFPTLKGANPYTGPLVFLVDEGTASTSEILAGALQEAGRAIVVGQPSLGAVLPSIIEKLPNGAIFQYAVADFKTPKGVLLEGRGVVPDVAVPLKRADFLAGRDPALDAALAYLSSRVTARMAGGG